MAKRRHTVTAEKLADAIAEELTIYSGNVLEAMDALSENAAKELVKKTKATAPVGARGGKFKRAIASKCVQKSPLYGSKYVWYVKPPEYRLTHLLVHGHATRDGGRTKSDPFLKNAVEDVLPRWEKGVEEAIKNGG